MTTRAPCSIAWARRASGSSNASRLDNAGASVSGVTRDGPYYFYEKLNPGDNSPKLYVRNVDGGDERVLVDPQALAGAGKHYTINYFLPSPDGGHVAYGISEGGSEASVIHVVETATGRVLPDAIDRALFFRSDELVAGRQIILLRTISGAEAGRAGDRQGDPRRQLSSRARARSRSGRRRFRLRRQPEGARSGSPTSDRRYSPVSPYTLGVIVHGVKMRAYGLCRARAAGSGERRLAAGRHATTTLPATTCTARRSTCQRIRMRRPSRSSLPRSIRPTSPPRRRSSPPAADRSRYRRRLRRPLRALAQRRIRTDQRASRSTPMVRPGAPTTSTLPYQGTINAISRPIRAMPERRFGLTGWTHSLLFYAADADGTVTDTHLKALAERRHVAVYVVGGAGAQRRRNDGAALDRLSQRARARRLASHRISRATARTVLRSSRVSARRASRGWSAAASSRSATCAAAAGTARPGTAPA